MQKFTTEEKYLYSVKSPYDKKKVYIYLFNRGVITGYYIQGEVEFKNGEKRNIYFNDDEENAKVKWTGKNSLIINNHIIEDVNRDFYNFKFEQKRRKENNYSFLTFKEKDKILKDLSTVIKEIDKENI